MNPLWAVIGVIPFALAPWIPRPFLFEWRQNGRPLWRLPAGRKVALTFDDGPDIENTPRLLDILDEYRISATFFVVGSHTAKYPDLVHRIDERGHDIGSHGMTHRYLAFRSKHSYIAEVREAVSRLEDLLGKSVFLFRPPYGVRSPGLYGFLEEEGLRPVLWDIMAYDWLKTSSRRIANRVLRSVREGSIILLHDGGGERSMTIASIPLIARGIRERGFHFTRLANVSDSSRIPTRLHERFIQSNEVFLDT